MSNVISAVCVTCGAEQEATPTTTTCKKCGGILDIKYDYSKIRSQLSKEKLADRKDPTIWRYTEFLPVTGESKVNKLRVGGSPLYKVDRLAEELGIKTLYIKDDGINPSASLKDRASAMAVVKAEEAGMTTIACSSTGNAASSLAGNASAAGFKTFIFVPERASKVKVSQLMIFGSILISVKGNYEDTFKLSA